MKYAKLVNAGFEDISMLVFKDDVDIKEVQAHLDDLNQQFADRIDNKGEVDGMCHDEWIWSNFKYEHEVLPWIMDDVIQY